MSSVYVFPRFGCVDGVETLFGDSGRCSGDFVVVGDDVQGRNCKLRGDYRYRQFRGFTNNDGDVIGPHRSFSLTVRFGVLERRIKIQHYGSIRSWEISKANLHKCRWFVVEVSVLGVSG